MRVAASDVNNTGMESGIATENAFMTVFLVALIFAAILLGALAIGYLGLRLYARSSYGAKDDARTRQWVAAYPAYARAWALRGALLCVLPTLLFAFYQWTLKDSWASILLSVLFLIAVLACVLPPVFLVIRSYLPSRLSRWPRDDDSEPGPGCLPLTASLRQERYYFLIPLLLAVLVKALVIGFGQNHGLVQTILLLIVEFFLLLTILVLRPHRTKGGDILSAFLAIFQWAGTRFVPWLMAFMFVPVPVPHRQSALIYHPDETG